MHAAYVPSPRLHQQQTPGQDVWHSRNTLALQHTNSRGAIFARRYSEEAVAVEEEARQSDAKLDVMARTRTRSSLTVNWARAWARACACAWP